MLTYSTFIFNYATVFSTPLLKNSERISLDFECSMKGIHIQRVWHEGKRTIGREQHHPLPE
jgi:hypothetical protein